MESLYIFSSLKGREVYDLACPLINICDAKITPVHAKRYCTGEYQKCPHFDEKRRQIKEEIEEALREFSERLVRPVLLNVFGGASGHDVDGVVHSLVG